MRILVLMMAALGVAGCHMAAKEAPVFQADASHATPWTHLEFRNAPENFQFAILADVEGGRRFGVFEKAAKAFDLLQPEFVMSIGDLSASGGDAEATRKAWERVDPVVKDLEMPFFYLAGNHDVNSSVTQRAWRERMGAPYYHFVYKDVLFLCLFSEDPSYAHEGGMEDAQAEYFTKALADNPSPRWTMVFMHKPLWRMNPGAWTRMESLLQDRPYTVFAGHEHVYTKYTRENDRRYYRLATTGGASGLSGPERGAFDQVVWVTMLPEGPRLAVLSLDGIFDDDVTTEMNMILKSMLDAGDVTYEPIWNNGPVFESAKSNITLVNISEVPVRIQGAFRPHQTLRVDPAEIDVEVPAKTLIPLKVPITIGAVEPLDLKEIPPLEFALTGSGCLPGQKPVSMGQTQKIVIDRTWPCPARATSVTVDGDLGEWDDLPLHVADITGGAELWDGPADFSVRFAAEHDEDYLYFAVEVTDDAFVFSKNGYPWFYDTVFMQLDVRADPERSRERAKVPQTADQFFLGILANPGKTPEERFLIPLPGTGPEGMEIVYQLTDKGYNFEMALPASYLDAKQGKRWEAFRLNMNFIDADALTGPRTQMRWLPHWGSPDNWGGSGTFVRQ